MKKRKLKIDAVNKIKIEKYEEFEESIFSEVYEKAVRYTKEIVEESKRDDSIIAEKKPFLNQETYNNIIPFLGDRGMGKSSAMLSYALFLRQYNKKITDPKAKYHLGEEVEFYLLPRIDAAMLIKGENLLDIILATMWKIFDEKQSYDERNQENAKKGFLSVKKSYELYIESISGREKKSMASVRDLKDLSKCLNLAQDFRNLVNSFLPCVSKSKCPNNFLVITLDDLDTATENVYAILEQIRLFLMLPNIIILASADLGRLNLECSKYFIDKLVAANTKTEHEINQAKSYAQSYLSKILPSNKRIFMPDMNIDTEYQIAIPKFKFDKEQTIKKTIYQAIYQQVGIMAFPNKRTNIILQSKTLREIVNVLYQLEMIQHMEKPVQRSEETIQWLFSKMEEYMQTLYGDTDLLSRCLKDSLNTETAYLNDVVLKLRKSSNGRGSSGMLIQYSERLNYQAMIKVLYELSDTYELPEGVCDFLTLLYSIRLSEFCMDEQNNMFFEKVDVGGIWRGTVNSGENVNVRSFMDPYWVKQEELREQIAPNKVQLRGFDIRFDNCDNFKKWLEQNQDEVYGTFSMALFCDANLWFEDKEGYIKYKVVTDDVQQGLKNGEKMDRQMYFSIKEKGDFTEASVENFFMNTITFEECLIGFLKNIYAAYCEEKNLDKKFEDEWIKTIFDTEEYHEWKKEYEINSLRDILPLESVEVMNVITDAVENMISAGNTGSMTFRAIDIITRKIDRITDILDKVERFYDMKDEAKYTVRIRKFIDKYGIKNNARKYAEKTTQKVMDEDGQSASSN